MLTLCPNYSLQKHASYNWVDIQTCNEGNVLQDSWEFKHLEIGKWGSK